MARSLHCVRSMRRLVLLLVLSTSIATPALAAPPSGKGDKPVTSQRTMTTRTAGTYRSAMRLRPRAPLRSTRMTTPARTTAAPAATAARGKVSFGQRVLSFGRNLKAFARGLLIDGPRQTLVAVFNKPGAFFGTVVGVGTALAVGHQLGINLQPAMAALSVGALGYQLKQAWPGIKLSKGAERWNKIGSDVAFPTAVVATTLVASHMMPSGATHAGPPGQVVHTGVGPHTATLVGSPVNKAALMGQLTRGATAASSIPAITAKAANNGAPFRLFKAGPPPAPVTPAAGAFEKELESH
jgi:hypothetical protein